MNQLAPPLAQRSQTDQLAALSRQSLLTEAAQQLKSTVAVAQGL